MTTYICGTCKGWVNPAWSRGDGEYRHCECKKPKKMKNNTQQTQNIPTAEYLLWGGKFIQREHTEPNWHVPMGVIYAAMIEFAQLHVKAQREAIINEIESDFWDGNPVSILNAYPESNIK